jgi:predicted HNH restriction endonuclease
LNYEEKYGVIGSDLIQVHHVTPLSAIGKIYEVDPVLDLIPLCASFHHVVHSRIPNYSVAEISNAVTAKRAEKTGNSLHLAGEVMNTISA